MESTRSWWWRCRVIWDKSLVMETRPPVPASTTSAILDACLERLFNKKIMGRASSASLMVLLVSFLLRCDSGGSPASEAPTSTGPDTEEASDGFITDAFSYRYGCYRPQVSLDGEWQFRRDKENKGKELGFHQGRGEFTQTIKLPGAPQAQGLGDVNTYQKALLNEPFWVR